MRLLPLFILLTAGCAGLAGCASPENAELPKDLISHNDFESLAGWTPAHPSLTTEKARSGRYSLRVGGGVEYSLTYTNLLSNISATRLNKLELSGWGMLPVKGSTAKLIVEVKNPADANQSIFWESIDLSEQIQGINKWTEVKKSFPLPANIEPTHELRVYMWRGASPTPTFLDDLTISRGE